MVLVAVALATASAAATAASEVATIVIAVAAADATTTNKSSKQPTAAFYFLSFVMASAPTTYQQLTDLMVYDKKYNPAPAG